VEAVKKQQWQEGGFIDSHRRTTNSISIASLLPALLQLPAQRMHQLCAACCVSLLFDCNLPRESVLAPPPPPRASILSPCPLVQCTPRCLRLCHLACRTPARHEDTPTQSFREWHKNATITPEIQSCPPPTHHLSAARPFGVTHTPSAPPATAVTHCNTTQANHRFHPHPRPPLPFSDSMASVKHHSVSKPPWPATAAHSPVPPR
jgi:hypothetical protein